MPDAREDASGPEGTTSLEVGPASARSRRATFRHVSGAGNGREISCSKEPQAQKKHPPRQEKGAKGKTKRSRLFDGQLIFHAVQDVVFVNIVEVIVNLGLLVNQSLNRSFDCRGAID